MVPATRIWYHLGWIVGAGWLVIGTAQAFVGLQGRAITDFPLWETYAWLGVGQVLLGVFWLLWFFVYHRPGFENA